MNEETFLSALRDDPADEVTWLALGDWLDESGQAERAELLRLTRQMRRSAPSKRRPVEQRVTELLRAGVRPVVVEIVNSLGMRFALVPAGRFFMGSLSSEKERNRDERRHVVVLTRPFWLGVFPVTQAQYRAVVEGNPSMFCPTGAMSEEVEGMDTGDFPVDSISWEGAQGFIAELRARPEEKMAGWEYRLPTEAEWEYACRGGGFTEPFCLRAPSHTLSSAQANCDGDYPYGGGVGPSLRRTCAVGGYEANPLGLHDMHGNVWEWCHDWYGEDYYREGTKVDPTGPAEGTRRAQHGGSWDSGGRYCRAAHRARVEPFDADAGFRLAFFPPGK
jgi:uncharacterized protein (TIGR02996 family)